MKAPPGPERKPSDLIFQPFRDFLELESAAGIILIAATFIALLWANSPWADSYHHLWEMTVTIGIGEYALSKHLIHWINDGLMAIFFCVVGLEIKREVFIGELSTMRKASFPIFAAFGGMVIPAGIYMIFNSGGIGKQGWGIPMATDIAFALGVLVLLGSRAPLVLKIFLTALAIIDDIGAVIVIAIFYTDNISLHALGFAGICLLLLLGINKLDVRHPIPYFLLGVLLWLAVLKSGIHATIAGVVFAMMVPARSRIDSEEFVKDSREILDELESVGVRPGDKGFTTEEELGALHTIKELSRDLETPLQRMEHELHSWTTYLIIPVFALANAGVKLNFSADFLTHGVTVGIFCGLVIGKFLGVVGFSWLAVRLGFAEMPRGISWRHICGVGLLAGIGFTMSLFITNLAFTDGTVIQMSKVGILAASLVAGIGGYLFLRHSLNKGQMEGNG